MVYRILPIVALFGISNGIPIRKAKGYLPFALPDKEHEVGRRQNVVDTCDDTLFAGCLDPIYWTESIIDYCNLKDTFDTCVDDLIARYSCPVEVNGTIANIRDALNDTCDTRCFPVFKKFLEFSATFNASDDDEFCSIADTLIRTVEFFKDNCDTNNPMYAFATPQQIQRFRDRKSSTCQDNTTTEPPTTGPPNPTNNETTSDNSTIIPHYLCEEVFSCPATPQRSLIPPGSFTQGFNFTEQFFEGVCNYVGELLDCVFFGSTDFMGCRYLDDVITGYSHYYIQFCTNDQNNKDKLLSLIPCMNNHHLQLQVFGAFRQMMGSFMTSLTWPTYYGVKDASNKMNCRAFHAYIRETTHYARATCGEADAKVVEQVLKAWIAVTEQIFGSGCPTYHPPSPIDPPPYYPDDDIHDGLSDLWDDVWDD